MALSERTQAERYCQSAAYFSESYLNNIPFRWRLIFSHSPFLLLELAVLNLHGHIHNSVAPELGARHVYFCVEVRDYRKWRLCDILTPYMEPPILPVR